MYSMADLDAARRAPFSRKKTYFNVKLKLNQLIWKFHIYKRPPPQPFQNMYGSAISVL